MDKTKHTGIILAGGKNSRMGKDKGLILWNGIPLAEKAAQTLAPFCSEILISANNNKYDPLGYQVIGDQYPDSGPMGGILTCLKHSKTDLNLVIAVDTPLVTSEIYGRMIEQEGSYDIIVCVDHKSLYQPLCSVFNKSIIPAMEEQVQKRILGIPHLIKKVYAREVVFHLDSPDYHSMTFFNVNSPADLEKISEIS